MTVSVPSPLFITMEFGSFVTESPSSSSGGFITVRPGVFLSASSCETFCKHTYGITGHEGKNWFWKQTLKSPEVNERTEVNDILQKNRYINIIRCKCNIALCVYILVYITMLGPSFKFLTNLGLWYYGITGENNWDYGITPILKLGLQKSVFENGIMDLKSQQNSDLQSM